MYTLQAVEVLDGVKCSPDFFRAPSKTYGLIFGGLFDLGESWDFANADVRKKVWQESAMCARATDGRDVMMQKSEAVAAHLEFACDVYTWHVIRGRKLLREHTWTSSSCNLQGVVLVNLAGVKTSLGHQCSRRRG